MSVWLVFLKFFLTKYGFVAEIYESPSVIGALIVKTILVNFSYFEISIGTSTLTHILFNRRLRFCYLLEEQPWLSTEWSMSVRLSVPIPVEISK